MLEYFTNEHVSATLIPGEAGTYVDGVWTPTPGTPESIQMIAPQPVNADELQNLEDGEHVRDYRKTWITKEVRTRLGTTDAGQIQWDGDTYKIMQVEDRCPLGNYHKAFIRKVDP